MIGRTMLNENIGVEFHQTPFGVCMIFFHNRKRIASYACEPNGCTSFSVGEHETYIRHLNLSEAIERVNQLVALNG